MKKVVLTTAIMTGLLVSSAFAYDKGNKSCEMGNKKAFMKTYKRGDRKNKGGSILSMIKKLNLTDEQKKSIVDIRKSIASKKQTPDLAFTKNSFDKEKFVEIMKQKRENMIESHGETIEKVYAVLTPKQKEQLKVLMDLRKEKKMAMMDKRMSFDKNCNGRR